MDIPLLRRHISGSNELKSALNQRKARRDDQTQTIVAAVIKDVRQRGDQALLDNARQYDAPDLESILVTPEELHSPSISENWKDAISLSRRRVTAFHEIQRNLILEGWTPSANGTFVTSEVVPGFLGQRICPLQTVGVYVPGGGAPYASSVIMNAVPPLVAGVPEVIICSPAMQNGSYAEPVREAIRQVGVSRAFKVGGAAAIAAMAMGTESVPRVDKVVGPGNRFVNEAKRQLWGTVGLDGYAGPSEVCVLADDSANADWAAADLLTQIEHAADNAAFLITLSNAKLNEILEAIERLLAGSPRERTMRAALQNESFAIVARDLGEAIDLLNEIAPEHVTLAIKDPEKELPRIYNAGCILLGEWTPESLGDFCLGPSHTLPTSGAARFGSPVNVLDFLKVQSVAYLRPEDLCPLISTVEAFGEMERFPIHGYGATIRKRSDES